MTKLRPLALSAAVTMAFGSLFLASPALAENSDASAQNPTVQAIAAGDALEGQTGIAELAVGAGTSTSGEAVLFIDVAEATAEVKDAANELDVKVALVAAAVAEGANDVVGGAGYFGEIPGKGTGACSVGFAAFSPEGDPALISAGHCSSDGAVHEIYLSTPSEDPAVRGPGYIPLSDTVTGAFGFSQFGGPGDTTGAINQETSTDISVIDITNTELTLLPEVTDWTTASDDDLAASATKITRVADPVSGVVSKSGRTTGLTTGNTSVLLPGLDGKLYPVEMLDGYMQVDGRWVHGFIGSAATQPGDSGGAVFQGTSAVGVVSGGPAVAPIRGDNWAWYTRLADALEYTGGYEVALSLGAPAVASPADDETVQPMGDITVAVPAPADELVVSIGSGGETTVAVVDGQATLRAPDEEGPVTYALTSKRGLSVSETVEHTVTVKKFAPRLTIDAITEVADAGKNAATIDLTGTGMAFADVVMNEIGETQVDADGQWTLADVSFGIGEHVVTATQAVDGVISAASSAAVTISPAVPGVVSITPHQAFSHADAPSQLSGTGLAGADVLVTLDGKAIVSDVVGAGSAPVAQLRVDADGEWTVALGGTLGAGTHTVTVSQTYNAVASATTTVVFTVDAAPVTPADPPATPDDQAAPVTFLPETGGGSLMPLALTGLGMLVLGGAAVLAARKLKLAS